MGRRELLFQESAIDMAAGAAESAAKRICGTVPLPMQQPHIVQNVFGIAAVEPGAVDQFIEVKELLAGIPGDQFDGQAAVLGHKSPIGRIGEMSDQEVAALDFEVRRWRAST